MTGVGLVPAAGAGRRFAAAQAGMPPKVLVLIEGEAMVRRTVRSLLAGGVDRCIVVTSADGEAAVTSALNDMPVTVIVNANPERGMFSSIQCGLSGIGADDRCILLPADMPFVRPETVAAILSATIRTGLTVAASHQGRRGHPMALSSDLIARLRTAPATAILSEERSKEVFLTLEVPDPGVHRDVDQPQDLHPRATTG